MIKCTGIQAINDSVRISQRRMHNLKPLWLFLHFRSNPEPVLAQSTFCLQFFLMLLYLLPNFSIEISRLVCVPYRISFWLSSKKSLFKSEMRNSFRRALKTSLSEDFLKVTFKVWVQITKYELKSTRCKFKSTSYEFKFTNYELQSTSYEFQSTSYESCITLHVYVHTYNISFYVFALLFLVLFVEI